MSTILVLARERLCVDLYCLLLFGLPIDIEAYIFRIFFEQTPSDVNISFAVYDGHDATI